LLAEGEVHSLLKSASTEPPGWGCYWLHTALARGYMQLEQYDEAARELWLSLSCRPLATWALRGLGMCLRKQGSADWKEFTELAISRAERALRENPNRVSQWLVVGNAYADLRQDRKSLEAYEMALNHDPGLPVAAYNAGCAHRGLLEVNA